MTYKVQLPVFEGPLDLLLYLIKKEEINIYDIPISKITGQYLEHLEVMKLLDLNIAGEFILMAATLIHIKSKMLLPIEENATDEIAEEIDPREELVRRLLEYKKFKDVASQFKEMDARQRDTFSRQKKEMAYETTEKGEKPYFEASLFDLITAFGKVLKEVPKDTFHQVMKDEFTVSEKIHDIFHVLVDRSSVCFRELFARAKSRDEVITTFLALLELVKLKEIVVKQGYPFAEMRV